MFSSLTSATASDKNIRKSCDVLKYKKAQNGTSFPIKYFLKISPSISVEYSILH